MTKSEQFNALFLQHKQPILDKLNERIFLKGLFKKLDTNQYSVTRSNTNGGAFMLEHVKDPVVISEELGFGNETVLRFTITLMTMDLILEDFSRFDNMFNKMVDAAINELGFMPDRAKGGIYLSACAPGFENKFIRLFESHNGYEFRLYSNCQKIID